MADHCKGIKPELNLSEDTIRRDLRELAAEGPAAGPRGALPHHLQWAISTPTECRNG